MPAKKASRAKAKKASATATNTTAKKQAPASSSKGSRKPGDPKLIVGIGASAGGLAALKRLFAKVRKDSHLTYVIVVHLAPDRESHLADLLQPHCRIPVEQVTETTRLKRDHVYVIPPNANLDSIDTHLRLSKLEEERRKRAPIDHFFRTLASTHPLEAVGIVLTGTGSDGALGIKEIKENGGITIAQEPVEAEHDGMPQAAISTGLVDRVLSVDEMAEAVLQFSRTKPRIAVPSDGDAPEPGVEVFLQRLFGLLRARTGRDFSSYKHSTLLRRVHRRMQMRQIEDSTRYLDYLKQHSEEINQLADDLLITVTSFFRDPETFEKLSKQVVPDLFEGKGADQEIRIWSVGCATGEEAYSLAILLLEEAKKREAPPSIQIFASDLHERSLAHAREGLYSGDITIDISPERLERFFTKQDGTYRIRKEVRDLVVFAPHNILSDPPFSKIDLVCCRNLLIYIRSEIQRDVIELFHYALRPRGYLLLGNSETLEASELFFLEDKKTCLFRKRNLSTREPRLPVFPFEKIRASQRAQAEGRADQPQSYGSIHNQLSSEVSPPSVLVSPDDKIVHLSERAGRFLVYPKGELSSNVFKLVREEFRIELRACLQSARQSKQPKNSIPISLKGEEETIVLRVHPARASSQAGFALVLFETRQTPLSPAKAVGASELESSAKESVRERELQMELDLTRQRLQAIIEEFETSQEELQASNEEMQSTNEELRSTMEELETSKEELQSMNEELQTVNQENRHKVEELSQLSGDLQNLLAATDIATLFLDRQLRILRFTPKIAELFNVRTTDRGRPLSDLTHRLGYEGLRDDALQVLEKLSPIEREVEDKSGRWYLTRIMPYRSPEDRIEGIVITFVEITQRKQAEIEIQQARHYAEEIVDTLPEPLLVLDSNLRVVSANAWFYKHFKVRSEKTIGRRIYDLGNGQWDIPKLHELLEKVLPDNQVFNGYQVEHVFDDLGYRIMLLNGRRLDHMELILLGIHDITERTELSRAVAESQDRQSFLLSLSDAIRPLNDPIEIQEVATRLVGQRLKASRAHFADVVEAGKYGMVETGFHHGVPSLVGRYPLDDYGFEAKEELRQGHPVVVADTQKDRRLSPDARAASAKRQVGSCIVAPIFAGDQPASVLIVQDREPRQWTPFEAQLVEDAAERVWPAVERARAEQAVRSSEERFRGLVSATNQVIYRMSPDWREMRELEGRGFVVDTKRPRTDWMDVYIYAEDHARVKASIEEAMDREGAFELEHRVQRADGSLGWALSRAVPIRDEQGEIIEWFGAASDVTERRLAEEERAKERALLDAILETLPVGIVMVDANGRIYRDNAASRELWGMPLAAESWEDYENYVAWWPETGERIKAEEWAMSRALSKGETIRNELVQYKPFNSEERRYYLNNVSPLKDQQGNVVGGVAAMLDVSERLEAEQALRRSEDRLSKELAAMQRLHELIARLLVSPDLATALDEVLAATIDIIGTGMATVQLVDPETGELEIAAQRGHDEAALEHIKQVSASQDSNYRKTVANGQRSVIEDLRRSDFFKRHPEISPPKSYRAVQSTPLTTRNGETVGVLSTHYPQPYKPSKRDMRILDLYARQATEFIEHVRRREEAKLDSQRKDAFLATLAHELRNPLAPIRSGIEILRQAKGDPEETEQMLSVMEREIRQLVVLVDDLLDVSRITRGKFELKKSRVDLRDIAGCAIDEAKPLIQEGGHQLAWREPRNSIFVEADPHRLAQVLSNLLTNAAKYTPQGGRIEMAVRRRNSRVAISVKDTGIGIPKDMQDGIFEMFTQVDRTDEIGRSGLGIGLTLVKSLVEMHGGSVEVKSDGADQGSEFIVRLPLATGSEPEQEKPAEKTREQPKASKQRVLVVDDNKSAAMTLSLLVRKLGHEAKTAQDGAAAIEAAREFEPHTILMDIGMPKMDGHEAARRIRQEDWGKKIKLVALTGWGAEKDKQAAKEAGFDEHLVKPADPARLQELLGRAPNAKVDFR